MAQILDFAASLTNPALLTLWGLAVGGLLTALGHWRVGAASVVLACGWTFVWSIPSASDQLRAVLERQHPLQAEEALPPADAIVVLGGGGGYGWMANEQVDADDLRGSRTAAGARAWLAARAPLVILSGGGAGESTEAHRMAMAMQHLGVPESALLLEQRSRSTRENAIYTATLAKRMGIQKILLVTSSLHMPRAVFEFQASGLDVVPVPTPENAGREDLVQRWRPSRSALRRSSRAFKELAALAVAHVQQRSRSPR